MHNEAGAARGNAKIDQLSFKTDEFQTLVNGVGTVLEKQGIAKLRRQSKRLNVLLPGILALHKGVSQGRRSIFGVHGSGVQGDQDQNNSWNVFELFVEAENQEQEQADRYAGLVVSTGAEILSDSKLIQKYDLDWRKEMAQELYEERLRDLKELAKSDAAYELEKNVVEFPSDLLQLEAELSSYSDDAREMHEMTDVESLAKSIVDPELELIKAEYLDYAGRPFRILNEAEVYVLGLQCKLGNDGALTSRFGISRAGDNSKYYVLDLDEESVKVMAGTELIHDRSLTTNDQLVFDRITAALYQWAESLPGLLAVS